MDKMPCHITDENRNDPADVPDAVDKEYEVTIPITATMVIKVSAETDSDAIVMAIESHTTDHIENIDWKTTDIEVEEL